ncbi:MAG: DUF4019 domain-containing protein [Steroidobacteraceae bacterium]
MRSTRHALGLFLLVLSAAPAGSAAGDTPKASAEAAARTWLAAADTGSGAETWALAARLFQDRISSEDWQKTLTGVRAPLGAVEKRTLTSATHAGSLPGAPDGDYEVVRFQTQFEHKASAVETVTTVKQPDGSWRVTGYFVN